MLLCVDCVLCKAAVRSRSEGLIGVHTLRAETAGNLQLSPLLVCFNSMHAKGFVALQGLPLLGGRKILFGLYLRTTVFH